MPLPAGTFAPAMEQPYLPSELTDRPSTRRSIAPALDALVREGPDVIAVMANMAAVLHEAFGWHWVGFYRVAGEELILGPFQGPVACTRIGHGKGVCGTAWKEARTILVPDVEQFPGHIACSALSRSEIVVPLRDASGVIRAVLDVDSALVNDLDQDDARFLERCGELLQPFL